MRYYKYYGCDECKNIIMITLGSCVIGDEIRLRVGERVTYVSMSLCLEEDQKTQTREERRSIQTTRISVEVIGFVITKTLSLASAGTHTKRTIRISKNEWALIIIALLKPFGVALKGEMPLLSSQLWQSSFEEPNVSLQQNYKYETAHLHA